MAKLKLHFRFDTNNTNRTEAAVKKDIRTATENFARFVVQDVAFLAADDFYKKARKDLARSVEGVIRNEIERMARTIAKRVAYSYKYAGPNGEISLFKDGSFTPFNSSGEGRTGSFAVSPLSKTAQASGFQPKFKLQSTGIKYQRWSERYKAYKKKKGTDDRWFRHTGSLQNWLKARSGRDYENAFGPVSVKFVRVGSLSYSQKEDFKLTSPSSRGRYSTTVQVGRLEVRIFRNITTAIMPGLSSLNPASNPLPGPGVASLLGSAGWDEKQVKKLLGRPINKRRSKWVSESREIGTNRWGKKKFRYTRKRVNQSTQGNYRPALDPFVSFFYTRAIPNAIWRRLEGEVDLGGKNISRNGR